MHARHWHTEPGSDGRFVFNGGQVIPTVVELTDPIQAWSIVPYGQSRRRESRHYADQAHLYSEGTMRPAWHAWSQLRDHVESVQVVEYRPPLSLPPAPPPKRQKLEGGESRP